jgi:hypothetical protein
MEIVNTPMAIFTNFIKQQIVAYILQLNGVDEWKNFTIVELAKCLLKGKGSLSNFWAEAVNIVVYVLNRSLTKTVELEVWSGENLDIQHFSVFGCKAFVHVPKENGISWMSKLKNVYLLATVRFQ